MESKEAIEWINNQLKSYRREKEKKLLNGIIALLRQGEAHKKKAKRLEIIIADYSLWLKANYKTMKIKDAAIYWKKLIEDYVFEGVRKVIEILGK